MIVPTTVDGKKRTLEEQIELDAAIKLLRLDFIKTFGLDSDGLLEMNLLKNSSWNLFSRLFLR